MLRDAVRHNNDLMQELKARDDSEARLVREAAIRAKVEELASELAGTTNRLGSMRKRMAETSEAMIVAARKAQEGSSLAKNASSEASANVSSVATASEQLLESIEEINRQGDRVDIGGEGAVAETQSANLLYASVRARPKKLLNSASFRKSLYFGVRFCSLQSVNNVGVNVGVGAYGTEGQAALCS